jgi:hypothetical protein
MALNFFEWAGWMLTWQAGRLSASFHCFTCSGNLRTAGVSTHLLTVPGKLWDWETYLKNVLNNRHITVEKETVWPLKAPLDVLHIA